MHWLWRFIGSGLVLGLGYIKFREYKGSAWAPAFAGAHASGRAGRHSDEEIKGEKL